MIYADNAATTRLSEKALEGMLPYLCEGFGNPSSLHGWGREAKKAVSEARELIASIIGATAEEIYFTSGGTESDNWAIKGVFESKKRERVNFVTSTIEHHAVLNTAAMIAKQGCEIRFAGVNSEGCVNPIEFDSLIDGNTILASVMMANNELGTVQDIRCLAEKAHAKGVCFHSDAVQFVGHVPLNVKDVNVDLLSASAHKFNGPKGIGFLYVKKGTELSSFVQGGAQEFGLRAGTENVASIVGMSLALQEHKDHFAERVSRVEHLSWMLKRGLSELSPQIKFNGSQESGWTMPGIVSVSIPGLSGEGLVHVLDMKGIATSTGAACNSKATIVSHVLQAIALPNDLAKSTIRISLSHENTEADVCAIVSAVRRVVCR